MARISGSAGPRRWARPRTCTLSPSGSGSDHRAGPWACATTTGSRSGKGLRLVRRELRAASAPRCGGAGEWELGSKAGFDTNVSRSVSGGKSDSYLLGYAAYGREPDGETRLDWSFSAVGGGAAYASLSDLDYAAIMFSPGLVYFYRPGWVITAAPFLRAKGVRDSNQSAIAFGGKLLARQQLPSDFYLGEDYAYTA